jgi:hypothetical protein
VGIIKAATTIGTNISTGGTITGSGANTLYGATSIGGALTATSTLNVTGLSIFDSNVGIGTSSPYAKLSVVGEIVGSYFSATSTTATSTFANGIYITSGCFRGANGSCISGGGSTSPGGSDTYVQFNNSGNFGGDSGLTFNSSTDKLTVGGMDVGGGLAVSGTLGTEKVTNGTFTGNANGWTLGAGIAYSSDHIAISPEYGEISQSIIGGVVAGETYRITYTITKSAGAYFRAHIGSNSGQYRSASGTYTENIMAIDTVDFKFGRSADFAGTLDDVSVERVTSGTATIDGTSEFKGSITGRFHLDGTQLITGTEDINGMGILELIGKQSVMTDYSNTLFSGMVLDGTGSEATATNGYFQLSIGAPSGTPTFTSNITDVVSVMNFTNAANYNIGKITSYKASFGQNRYSAGTNTIGTINSFEDDDSASDSASGTFNVTNWNGLYLSDMASFSNGTVANKSGIWIEPQTIGTTENYGIVLDGNGPGSGIIFGANQEAKISYDGSNAVLNGNPIATTNIITTSDSKEVCSKWASIANPYMCLSYLTPVTTETDMIGGYQFTYNNVISSEITVKSQVWTLNGTGGNEYLSRDDSNATFSWGNSTTDSPFSIVAVVEVVNTGSSQMIISKDAGNGSREWLLDIDGSRNLFLQLADQSIEAYCNSTSNSALSVGWHMLVMTYDGTSLSAGEKFYDNGALISSTGTNCAASGYVAMENLAGPVTIGAKGNLANNWQGDMGHVAVFANELQADQILKMYNSAKMFYGL